MQELDLFTQQIDSVKAKDVDFNIPLANKIENYYEKIMPELTNRQSAVVNSLKLIGKPCTMHEVASFMDVPLNTISGRFGELVKKEKLKVIGRTNDRKSIYEVI